MLFLLAVARVCIALMMIGTALFILLILWTFFVDFLAWLAKD
jgi:hypothetical protein